MAIKVGDIVKYDNKQQRVMGFAFDNENLLRLSHESKSAHINVNNVTLIESFVKPDIKIGDFICISDIPGNEQTFYMDANKPVDDDIYEVIDILDKKRFGMVVSVLVNGEKHHYMAQYVKKVHDYDMI